MLCDDWSRAGFTHGKPVFSELDNHEKASWTDYKVWHDKSGVPVGVTVSFESAYDDLYINIAYSDWLRFLEKELGMTDPDSNERIFEYFEKANDSKIKEALKRLGIKYDMVGFASFSDDF